MTQPASTRQLLRRGQTLFGKHLPQWMKHRGYGLYRRTEDFVQWLILNPSSYEDSFRIHYSIQALAEQFPTENLTLGDLIRNDAGGELRFTIEVLTNETDGLAERVIRQISPASETVLSAEIVGDFLEERHFEHVSALVAQGIAGIVAGNSHKGRTLLYKAANWYEQIDTVWAKSNLKQVQKWLALDEALLLGELRQDAQVGASILRIK